MVFWGQVQNYMLRQSFSILVVDMVADKNQEGNATASNMKFSSLHSGVNQERFDWDEWTQGVLHSSFRYGYGVTQVFGGRIAEVIGFKKVFGSGLLFTAILSVLTPVVVNNLHYGFFIALRSLQGIFEGVTIPALHVMTARWVEPAKRSSFIARSYLGSMIGLMVTFPFCGALSTHYGWEIAYYITGLITVVWFIAWIFLVFDSPDKVRIYSMAKRKQSWITFKLALKKGLLNLISHSTLKSTL